MLLKNNALVFAPFAALPKPAIWFLACWMALPLRVLGQPDLLQQPVSLTVQHIPLGDALDTLAAHAQVYFTYNAQLIDSDKIVSVHQVSQPLHTVLQSLLEDSTLYFHLVKKQVIISNQPFESDPLFSASTDATYLHLNGTVVDAGTHTPLPYAHIGILNTMAGTTTNNDGSFHLSYTPHQAGDSVKISFIGYKNYLLVLPDTAQKLEIKLQPDYISLQEVIIRSSDPKILIQQAVKKFPETYMQQPANYVAFYRESVKKNKNYMIYLESVLDIYKTPYHETHFDTDAARVQKSRKVYDVQKLDTVSFRLQGGVEGCLQMDVVKHPPDFLLEELSTLYRYTLQNINTYNEQPVYVIDCQLKEGIYEPLMEGRLYISVRELAIIRAEFYYPQHIVKKLSSRFITQKSAGTRVTPALLAYTVQYKSLDGRYYLSHAKGHLTFKVKSKKKLFSSTFDVTFEMATTRVDTQNVQKIKRSDRLKPDVILSKEMEGYDAAFWGNATFVEPEEDIQHALMRMIELEAP